MSIETDTAADIDGDRVDALAQSSANATPSSGAAVGSDSSVAYHGHRHQGVRATANASYCARLRTRVGGSNSGSTGVMVASAQCAHPFGRIKNSNCACRNSTRSCPRNWLSTSAESRRLLRGLNPDFSRLYCSPTMKRRQERRCRRQYCQSARHLPTRVFVDFGFHHDRWSLAQPEHLSVMLPRRLRYSAGRRFVPSTSRSTSASSAVSMTDSAGRPCFRVVVASTPDASASACSGPASPDPSLRDHARAPPIRRRIRHRCRPCTRPRRRRRHGRNVASVSRISS